MTDRELICRWMNARTPERQWAPEDLDQAGFHRVEELLSERYPTLYDAAHQSALTLEGKIALVAWLLHGLMVVERETVARCLQIASDLEDDDCTAGAVWEAIRVAFPEVG